MSKKLLFENTPCGRCGGSGRMPFAVYAGLCFKCNGAGALLTKRGRAAQEYLNSLRTKPGADFRVGDLFLYEGFTAGSFTQPSRWYEVHEIAEGKLISRDHGGMSYGYAPGQQIRYGLTGEQKAINRAAALAYQETLTKMGKPRAVRA